MDLGLRGRTAVVTGAGAGIGLAIVKAFVAEGANVVGGSRRTSSLLKLASEYPILPVSVDLAVDGGAELLADSAVAEFGGIDVLVNNVGETLIRSGFLGIADSDWYHTLNVNFMSMVRTTRAVLPHMVKNGSGAVINIASVSARQPNPFFADYGASKAAMVNLSKALALEFGAFGIRVNCVSPGPVRTATWDARGALGDFLAEQYGLEKEAAIEHYVKEVRKLPLGKIGTPEDVAALVLVLASDVAQNVTGADYSVVDSLKTV